MKNNYNVIGDVAGNYKTLLALIEQMPKDAELICLGDPIDRGPRSKEVVEYLMKNGRTINSNHAHMLCEEWKQHANPGAHPRYYEKGIWPHSNGGMTTIFSYGSSFNDDGRSWTGDVSRVIPKDHYEFLRDCPMYIETEDFILTHAPCTQARTLEEMSQLGRGFSRFDMDYVSDGSLLWNRYVPRKPNPDLKGKINIFGHNASDKVKVYNPKFPNGIYVKDSTELAGVLDGCYGICIDTSRRDKYGKQKLTGLHLPTMTIYQQEYID